VLVHGVVAALVVESVIQWQPIAAPRTRLAYRVTALLAPILLALVLPLLPSGSWWREAVLFDSRRWAQLHVAGIDVRAWGVGAAAIAGAALLIRDVIHAVSEAWRTADREASWPRLAAPSALLDEVASLSRRLGIAVPSLDVLVTPAHVLHCRGSRRPRIVISTGVLDTLPAPGLRAALAHELAHIAHRDVRRSWLLLLLRAMQWFNPLAQAVGRRAAQELEWRADDRAAHLTGAGLALARAIVVSAREHGDRFLGISGRGRLRSIEERCQRLMEPGPTDRDAWRAGDIAALWAGLSMLLVFVQ
jgi:Zn-dependent protease with chaperone function